MRLLWLLGAVVVVYVLAESGERSTTLGKTDVEIRWKADYKRQAVTIHVNMSNTELDWIGIGFSDHGEFNNSDVCVFKQGKLRVAPFLTYTKAAFRTTTWTRTTISRWIAVRIASSSTPPGAHSL